MIEFFVRELLGLVISNGAETKGSAHTAKLEPYLRTLESKGVKPDKYTAILFPMVESCIPENNFEEIRGDV